MRTFKYLLLFLSLLSCSDVATGGTDTELGEVAGTITFEKIPQAQALVQFVPVNHIPSRDDSTAIIETTTSEGGYFSVDLPVDSLYNLYVSINNIGIFNSDIKSQEQSLQLVDINLVKSGTVSIVSDNINLVSGDTLVIKGTPFKKVLTATEDTVQIPNVPAGIYSEMLQLNGTMKSVDTNIPVLTEQTTTLPLIETVLLLTDSNYKVNGSDKTTREILITGHRRIIERSIQLAQIEDLSSAELIFVDRRVDSLHALTSLPISEKAVIIVNDKLFENFGLCGKDSSGREEEYFPLVESMHDVLENKYNLGEVMPLIQPTPSSDVMVSWAIPHPYALKALKGNIDQEHRFCFTQNADSSKGIGKRAMLYSFYTETGDTDYTLSDEGRAMYKKAIEWALEE